MPKTGEGGFRRIAALSSLGLTLPSSIAVGLFFGYLLDKTLNTSPWMLLAFLLLGIVSGFYSLFKGLTRLSREKSAEEGQAAGSAASPRAENTEK